MINIQLFIAFVSTLCLVLGISWSKNGIFNLAVKVIVFLFGVWGIVLYIVNYVPLKG